MYSFAKVVLIILAFFAFFEGVSAYSQAKSAFHQIYAAVWFAVFAISLGTSGIISALTREVEGMAELKAFLQRVKNKVATKQSADDQSRESQATVKSKPQGSPVDRQRQTQNVSRQCPYCGADTPADAKSCLTCTRILNPYVPCPKCKADISHKPSECPECGSKITWKNASDTTK